MEGIFRRIADGNHGEGENWERGETKVETETETRDRPGHTASTEAETAAAHYEREPDRRYRLEREQREREREREREWQGRSGRERYPPQRHGSMRPPRSGRSPSPGHNTRPHDAFRPGGRQYGRGGTGGGFRRSSSTGFENTRLVVDKIPPAYCSIAKVNEYFERFGKITNITVHPEIQRARIEFSTREEAAAAHSCPDVLFENRFVKVYWDHEELPTPTIVKPAPFTTPMARPPPPMMTSSSAPPTTTAVARVEAAQRKQEALKGMLELQRQKQELLLKYITRQKELLSILETKSLPEADKQEMLQKLRSIDELIKSLDGGSLSERTVATRPASADGPSSMDSALSGAEPGAGEVEGDSSSMAAAPLAKSAPASTTTTPILRGGPAFYGRGRGRGAYYGGTYYQPHQYRAPFNRQASLAAHRLDLRPTAFIIRPIPALVGADISSLRKLFAPYGEIKNISIDGGGGPSAIVSFARRIDAERAHQFISKADFGGESLEIHWISSSAAGGIRDGEDEREERERGEQDGTASSLGGLSSIRHHPLAAGEIESLGMERDSTAEAENGARGEERAGIPGADTNDGTAEDHIRFDEEEREGDNEESHWKR